MLKKSMLYFESHAELIQATLKGKYLELRNSEQIHFSISSLYQKYIDFSEKDLLETATPTIDLETDISNQVRCYILIEKYWRCQKPISGFLQNIHSIVMGLPHKDVCFRSTASVPDFPGIIPTGKEDILSGIAEIEQQLSSLDEIATQSNDTKSSFLASLFALIIRVHPFQDGNGRTARILVQYCLRYWGYQYIILPKVRNDEVWKNALGRAINGDHDLLSQYFHSRLIKCDNND